MFQNCSEKGNIAAVFKPCSKQVGAQRRTENASAGRRLWQWHQADLALPVLIIFSLLQACCPYEYVWRNTSSGSHDSLESPTFPECSHLNHSISIRQRSSFLSDKRAEYIWNPGKGAVSTWFRQYPSCQAKTMTKQCRISKSFDTHPETMAAGLSVKHSDRITYYSTQLYLM